MLQTPTHGQLRISVSSQIQPVHNKTRPPLQSLLSVPPAQSLATPSVGHLDRCLLSPTHHPPISKFSLWPSELSQVHPLLSQGHSPSPSGNFSLPMNLDAFLTGQPLPLPLRPVSTLLYGDYLQHKLCHYPDESLPITPTSLRTKISSQVLCGLSSALDSQGL